MGTVATVGRRVALRWDAAIDAARINTDSKDLRKSTRKKLRKTFSGNNLAKLQEAGISSKRDVRALVQLIADKYWLYKGKEVCSLDEPFSQKTKHRLPDSKLKFTVKMSTLGLGHLSKKASFGFSLNGGEVKITMEKIRDGLRQDPNISYHE